MWPTNWSELNERNMWTSVVPEADYMISYSDPYAIKAPIPKLVWVWTAGGSNSSLACYLLIILTLKELPHLEEVSAFSAPCPQQWCPKLVITNVGVQMPHPLASRRAQVCGTIHTLICSGEHRIPLQTDFGSSSFITLLSFPLFLNDFYWEHLFIHDLYKNPCASSAFNESNIRHTT